MSAAAIPQDLPRKMQDIADEIGMVGSEVELATELLEDAVGCFLPIGDRLARGQVTLLIFAIQAKAATLDRLAAELLALPVGEVGHG